MTDTLHRLSTEPAADVQPLEEARIGQYRVQAYRATMGDNPIVWRVLALCSNGEWRKVRCWTDAEERAFPKTAAKKGHEMVTRLKSRRITAVK